MRRLCILLSTSWGWSKSHWPTSDVAREWSPAETKPGWGCFIDPDGDCKQVWKDGTLTFEVPGNVHELQGNGRRNAPRLLAERSGDFAMSVRAAGKLSPKQATGEGFLPYHGAGLLVMEHDSSFLRLERAKILQPNGNEMTYINFEEHRASGARPIKQLQLSDEEIVHLRIERRRNKIVGLLSRDSTTWEELGDVSFPYAAGAVKVGVAAVNSSRAAFIPEFSDFRLFEAKG